MWPVLRAPHRRVYGEPSDPLGEVWRLERVADVPVTTTPPPAPLPGGDPRVAGIGVHGLAATVACADGEERIG